MISSQELQQKVIEALAEKIEMGMRCPLCQVDDWNVQIGTTFLPLRTESPNGSSWNQQALPSAALICGNCGNTHLLNLSVLLPDLVNRGR